MVVYSDCEEERSSMIYRDTPPPEDGREWTAIRTPTREFIDKLDRNGNDVYILKDPDGVTWAIYAEPLLTNPPESV